MNYETMKYIIEGDHRLEGAAFAAAFVLAYRADRRTGEACVSRRRLAREARISASTVHRTLDHLLKVGVVGIVLEGTGRRATIYRILVPSDSTTEPLEDRSGITTEPLQGPSDSTTESQPNPGSDSTTEPQEIRSDSPRQALVAPLWDSYIRKEGKNIEGKNGAAPPSPPAQDADASAAPTRCRHRNDPSECGICSNPVGTPPPRGALSQALRREDHP